MLIAPRGSALNLEHNELYVIDKIQNALFTFDWREVLERKPASR